jgi:predicted outer membrane repeat protein
MAKVQTWNMRPIRFATIFILLALVLPAASVQAGGVVSVCDESHLKSALAGGGTVGFSCSGTITLTSTITISANTTLDGTGQAVTLSGNNAVGVFKVSSGVSLTLNKLTIANGRADAGGGVFISSGTLTVSNSTFSGNRADNYGGAIYGGGGQVTVSDSAFSGNGSSFLGAGIYNNGGTLTVSRSSFAGNSAAQDGGGIASTGAASVSDSTFSGNSSGERGGAIVFATARLTVSNSTFSGNSAYYGGGIAGTNSGTLTVANSTFSGNWAACDGFGCYGGAIYNYGATMTLQNTIVANSTGGNNCAGYFSDGGGNLSYPDGSCPGINANPVLGPLQHNSGPTQTMLPGAGSPAIDAANDATCAAPPVNNLDQRGITRPQGLHCDIGAAEVRAEEPGGVVSVCDETHLLSALSSGGTVTFACSGTILLTNTITISADTTIDGSGQAVTISGGGRNRVFTVSPGITLSLNGLTIADGQSAGPYGGGVSVTNGALNVSNSTFSHNGAAAGGGGIYGKGSQVTVSSSTFAGNWSDRDGGAIYSDGGGPLTVSNSTFYDNTAANLGGAIYSRETASASVGNSTFSANRAWSGWAVYSDGTQYVVLQNTIVADTTSGDECRGRVTDGGGNLSYPEYSCGGIHSDPLLGALQNNGGPTQTMALGAGSPAIDTGTSAACQVAQPNNRDQRGYARFVDGNGDTVAQCDIGAFEYGASGPPTATLDKEPPEVAIELTPATPDGANGWYRSPVTVQPRASDASPVVELRCVLDPAGPPAAFDDLPEENCPFLFGDQVAAEGRHTFYAAAMDVWGNKSAPVSASFKIDTPPPGLTSLEMTVNRGEAYAGAILEYKLMVRNLTPAAQGFTVTDPIPAYTEIVRRIDYNPATNAVEWSGIVEPWGFKTFTVYVRIKSGTPGGTAIVNTATIEDEPGGGSVSAATIVKTLPPYRGHREDVEVNEMVIRGN